MTLKNYITPSGMERLKDEALHLIDVERPELVKVIHWAASNGDRSENGDYIYGKKRLREIDKRIRLLTKKLDNAMVIDPEKREKTDQVFFGATVSFQRGDLSNDTISIVGVDEADAKKGLISWISPLATSLLKARAGDTVYLDTPSGQETLKLITVQYKHIIIG
jgi:transcription elongation factor GreB